jgi:hypothetical protein
MTDVPVPADPALLQRLARLFAPSTNRAVKRLYPAENAPPAKFAHYTSADTALKIIRDRKLWMRNTACMADYREVMHGHEMMMAWFNDGLRGKLIEALDSCQKGIATEAIGLFDQHWHDTLFNTFITCVSEHDEKNEDMCGRLSMWRAFAPNTTRVALVFGIPLKSDAVGKLGLIFSPVAYFSSSQMRHEIEEIIADIEREREFLSEVPGELLKAAVFVSLLAGHVAVKHPGFHEEREWRAIYGPARWQSPIMLGSMSIETPFGVPQRIFKIPLDGTIDPAMADLDFPRIFHRLIIGPSPYGSAMEDAFIRELTNAGVKDAHERIVRSDIPIRSLM